MQINPEIAREHLRLLIYHIKGKILHKERLSRLNPRVNRFAGCH